MRVILPRRSMSNLRERNKNGQGISPARLKYAPLSLTEEIFIESEQYKKKYNKRAKTA